MLETRVLEEIKEVRLHAKLVDKIIEARNQQNLSIDDLAKLTGFKKKYVEKLITLDDDVKFYDLLNFLKVLKLKIKFTQKDKRIKPRSLGRG